MKIDIKNKKKPKDYSPKLKDLVQHTNGAIGAIYGISSVAKILKIIVLSSFELEEGDFNHSKVVQEWRVLDTFPFEGSVTFSN